MNDWVPCYRSLMTGRKRALPRATRFIFLELCSEAREGGGIIELAPGLSLGEAVLDLIGGNRREVHAAVTTLLDEDMLDAHARPGFLVITNWDRWKLRDRTNADRQAAWRERKRVALAGAQSNGSVTPDAVTEGVTRNESRNGRNGPRSDQRRKEKKRSAAPPLADHDPPKNASTKINGKTDPDFEAECARAAAIAEAKRRERAAVARPVSLSAADFQILEGKKP